MSMTPDNSGQCERCGTVFTEDVCQYQEATAEYVCPECLSIGRPTQRDPDDDEIEAARENIARLRKGQVSHE